MIDLTPAQRQTIADILQRLAPDCEARAFGSRVRGAARSYSDLDLAIVGRSKLPFKKLAALRIAFEESDLPFRVDVLDWHSVSPEFRKVIEQNYETLRTANAGPGVYATGK
ncbi:MAG: nucleotidyltransferase family protein [Chloroflexota bacterium]